MDSPIIMMMIVFLILGLKVWLALAVDGWAKRKGRTGRGWFLCAFLWLIPTAIVLACLRNKSTVM